MQKLIFTILFSFYLFFGNAQDIFDQIRFNVYNEDFPKRGVRSIIEDQDGFMWFTSDGAGLFRADGNELKQFNYQNGDSTSINGNFVLSNYIDSKNRMWAGTRFGLNLFNPELETFQSISSINKLNPNGRIQINCIVQKGDDFLYLGTDNHGLIKLDINTLQIASIPFKTFAKTNLEIRKLIVHDGKVYGATSKGLMVLNEEENLFQLAEFLTKDGKQTITNSLEILLIDDKNGFWIGTTKDGLINITGLNDITQIYKYPFTDKRIISLLYSKENQLFCGAENDGLFLAIKDNVNNYTFKRFKSSTINSNSIWCLYQDSRNRIWAGTFNKGVSVYDQLYNKFYEIIDLADYNNLHSRAISSIIEDDIGNLWIGLDGGGIDIYNPITKKLQGINSKDNSAYKGLSNDDIISLYMDGKGNIWVGTWGAGIYFLKKGTKQFINYTKSNTNGDLTCDRIFNFSEDSRGRIWIATYDSGIVYFDPTKNTFVHCNTKAFKSHKIPFSHMRSVVVDKFDNIWVASVIGFFKITVEEQATGNLSFNITSFKKEMAEVSKNHPSINNTSSILIVSDQQLLVGTEGAGLYIYNYKSGFKHFDESSFQQKTIGPIVMGNNNNVWVSGEKGITNIDLKTSKVVNYTKNDGFFSNYLFMNSIYSTKDGIIYYGNDVGLNYFKPTDIEFNSEPPRLHFTNFKIYNKEITPSQENSPLSKVISKTKTITLDPYQRVFTIDYVGINFTRPEKNQYAYQLEGVDPSWRYVGNKQSATYTNLKPGDYTFKVKATNNDGLWNSKPLELAITILTPWWKSNLAYLCYLLLSLVACFYLLRIFRQRINEKQNLQIERQKRLQEEKLSQQKLEFFTNISHEFKTPLTLILNPLEDILGNENIRLPAEIKTKHQIIYKNSHRLNRLINELMDFRKLQFSKISIQAQQVDVISFVKETLSYFSEEALQRNINLQFESNSENLVAWLDVNMLEKIIFNLISNAFKATPYQGSISIFINEKQIKTPDSDELQEGFEISVKDTGAGLTQSEISHIFQRFSQVNSKLNNQYGGTGIGLEVVKAFMKLHKGKIDVKSKVGSGSTFTISFLLGKAHFNGEEIIDQKYEYTNLNKTAATSNSEQTKSVKNAASILNQEALQKEDTILIVEDNLDLRNYLKTELVNDYNILIAENGKEAFEIAQKESPQIILTDVMMPVMNGLELCKKIKSDLQTSHIPLLMLTAKSTQTDKLQGINSGADAFLSKPIEMKLLRSTLNQLLTSRQILFNKFSNGVAEINEASPKKITALDNVFIKKMVTHINENISELNLSVESIANHFFLSRSQLYRKTKALTGISVNEMIKKIRLEKAFEMIKAGDGNISEISLKVGFSSPSYFAKCFKEEYNKLPTEVH